jgi:hypothetical protein
MAHLAFCTPALVAMQRLLRHGIEGEAAASSPTQLPSS